MKNLLVLAFTIWSSFAHAEIPNKPELQDYKTLDAVQWIRLPRLSYHNRELQGKDRTVTIKIYVSETGLIEKTKVIKSSGIEALDLKVQRDIRSGKFRPYTENGIAYAFIATQPFHFRLSPNADSL